MTEGSSEKYWRIRMRYTGDKENRDYSEAAWKRNEVGIWYGAWSATDFASAIKNEKPEDILIGSQVKHNYLGKLVEIRSTWLEDSTISQ